MPNLQFKTLMHRLPVAVALHFLSRIGVVLWWGFFIACQSLAGPDSIGGGVTSSNNPAESRESAINSAFVVEAPGYLARIDKDSPGEVLAALRRAENWFSSGHAQTLQNPLTFVLHGPEVEIFMRGNYPKYKEIVDLAARLTAFEVVKINICQTRLNAEGGELGDLVPFVQTVPFGPAEVSRLVKEEKYLAF